MFVARAYRIKHVASSSFVTLTTPWWSLQARRYATIDAATRYDGINMCTLD